MNTDNVINATTSVLLSYHTGFALMFYIFIILFFALIFIYLIKIKL